MADLSEGHHPAYCGQCGESVQPDDRFCGSCGAAVLPPAPQAEQVVPRPVAAAQGAGTSRRSRPLLLAGALGALVVLLAGGALAATLTGVIGPDREGAGTPPEGPRAGGAEVPSSSPGVAGPEVTAIAEGTAPSGPDAPHPAFDPLLPTLAGMTSAPVLLPADLPAGFQDAAVDEATEGDGFGILFLGEGAESSDVVQPFVNAFVDGTLEAAPVEEGEPELPEQGQDFELTSGQAMTYGDGAVGAYNCYEPSPGYGGTGGPFCDGVYTRGDYRYRLTLEGSAPPEQEMGEMLSSMMPLDGTYPETTSSASPPASPEPTAASPEPTAQEPTDFGLAPGGEEEVRNAAEQYYYAVDSEVWDTTYYNLDAESKALFTEEEWAQKNQWYADNEDLELESIAVGVEMDGEEAARVTVDRVFTDGTSISRETVFVWEGYWRHRLTEEEKEIFMPGVPYAEFVEAQG